MNERVLTQDLTDPIRNFLNATEEGMGFRDYLLDQSLDDWNRLCAALDAADDAQLAIQTFLSRGRETRRSKETGCLTLREGQKYLDLYGVFQAVVVQQDAIEHIREIVEFWCTGKKPSDDSVWYAPYKCAQELRQYRNLCVGHPVVDKPEQLKRRGNTACCFINRNTLAQDLSRFTILRWDAKEGQDKEEEIRLAAMLQDYIQTATTEIASIRETLEQCSLKLRSKGRHKNASFENP
jgi:hypothetical protein